MTDFWKTVLEFAQTTSLRIGSQLKEDFGQVQADAKTDGSLVTKADKWADKEIQEAISQTFPEHGLLSEEGQNTFPGTQWCWVIDPIDGTTNFTRGIPLWGISMGLLYKGIPVFGYVYVPTTDEEFYGFWQGNSGLTMPSGAFRNQQPIHTSSDEPSNQHFFNLCSRSTDVLQRNFPCKIRMLGAATYNFLTVSTGAVLGGIEATPKVWDIAAAWVIVQAAGGVWKSLKAEPFPLQTEQEYSDRSYPTLVVSRSDLLPVFMPFLER
ncbi:MAG: inositol monophosphatase family protein [Cyanobacteria bacterium P01_A01_bin.45]